jgi:hypothetical protein
MVPWRTRVWRAAITERDLTTALRESALALEDWKGVRGFRDVRMGPYLERVRATVLLASGDGALARALALSALNASRGYDSPTAASIAEAEALNREAGSANGTRRGPPSH